MENQADINASVPLFDGSLNGIEHPIFGNSPHLVLISNSRCRLAQCDATDRIALSQRDATDRIALDLKTSITTQSTKDDAFRDEISTTPCDFSLKLSTSNTSN